MNNAEIIVVVCSWIGVIIAICVLWYLFGGFSVDTGPEIVIDEEKTNVLTNIGIEVAGIVGAVEDDFVPITGLFKHCYLIGFASGDYLFRFYIYKRKIFYTIEDFASDICIENTFKIKNGVIDFAALGTQLSEDFNATFSSVGTVDFETAIDKAQAADENQEITDELLVQSVLELVKNKIAEGDATTGTIMLTTLLRFAPDLVEQVAHDITQEKEKED